MESVAHSRQPNKVSATLSKKITNGNNGGFSSKTLYDDVYGGPPKFGVTSLSPRFEDYGEIFGSFHTARASSIPVLDLPVVDEAEVFFDVQGSGFDYAEVFGGFNGLDFAVSYEHLFHQPHARGAVSSEEAWTPEETGSVSEGSDCSGNNQSISNGDPYQTVDGSTEFNISYHKVNRGSNGDMSKGKTHITQFHAVPGFTLVFDETAPLFTMNPSLQVVDDIDLDMDFAADKMKGSHLRKTMSQPSNQMKRSHLRKTISQPSNHTFGEQTFGNDPKLHNGSSRSSSHSSESFITVSDISLRTRPSQVPPPSRPPPILDGKKWDTGTFHLNSEWVSSEGAQGDSSPPFFDVEVDMNSSAAASAAAMKEAMHKAEAKLRSAKELKERKKAGLESHAKLSHIAKRDNENKMSENLDRSSSLKDERLQSTSDRRYSKMKIPATDESQKAMKSAPETPDLYEGERLLNVSQKTAEEMHVKKSGSSQGLDRSIEVGTWKEATEFFELVGTENPEKVFQLANCVKSSEQDMRTHEDCLKEKDASNLHEENRKVKVSGENCQMEESKKKFKAAKEASEQDKNLKRSASTDERKQKELAKKEKFVKPSDQEGHEKNTKIAHELIKIEKKVTEADQSGYLANLCETRHKEHKQMEGQKSKEIDRLIEVPQGLKLKENDKKLNEAEKNKESVKKSKQSVKIIHNEERREALALEQAEGEVTLKESVKLEENDGKLKEGFKQYKAGVKEACGRDDELRLKQAEQTLGKKPLKEACEREEIEKNLKDVFPKEVSSEDLKQAVEQAENVRPLTEAFELEMNEKRQTEAFEQDQNEKRVKEATERDQNKKTFKEVCDRYENEEWLQEVGGSKGKKVLNQAPEQEKNIEILTEGQRREEIESSPSESVNKDESESLSIEGNEDGNKLMFAEPSGGMWNMEIDENLLPAQSAFIHEEDIEGLEKSEGAHVDQEHENTKNECGADEKKSEEVIIENLVANKKIRVSKNTAGDLEHSRTQSGKGDGSVTKADGLGFANGKTCTEKIKIVSQLETDSRNQERKFAHEWGERGKNNQHLKVPLRQEESGDQTSSSRANLCGDSRKNIEAAEPAPVPEAANSHKTAQRFHVGQSPDKKERNLNETCTSEEKDRERMRRERQLEKDRLRKIEEEREREREREKDRMAVDRAMLEPEREREREKDRMGIDRATLEAREKAYSEPRERVERAAFERATAEARQRALAEARERLEKACAEARDKSFADKGTVEARLKAERAAVERASAEARERAMERAKVERAAFESRERLERSVSDKFSVSLRNGGSRQGSSSSDMQDPQFQNSKHPYSSVYGASSFSERSEGGEGESAQRYRARLERYRRTAERAAKALAEKNMRDLLAQKEQAERSRLAETLDAEVRRWSSGKEGNLRALLSTLQYILGPDSGWQPIPLTEVITSAAVKKAYRKATLCVHPDKLQQRGASIQHKYICEKVFDLLKEAWNKFNSEER